MSYPAVIAIQLPDKRKEGEYFCKDNCIYVPLAHGNAGDLISCQYSGYIRLHKILYQVDNLNFKDNIVIGNLNSIIYLSDASVGMVHAYLEYKSPTPVQLPTPNSSIEVDNLFDSCGFDSYEYCAQAFQERESILNNKTVPNEDTTFIFYDQRQLSVRLVKHELLLPGTPRIGGHPHWCDVYTTNTAGDKLYMCHPQEDIKIGLSEN